MLIKWLNTKENVSYENNHSGESNSRERFKPFVEGKILKLR